MRNNFVGGSGAFNLGEMLLGFAGLAYAGLRKTRPASSIA